MLTYWIIVDVLVFLNLLHHIQSRPQLGAEFTSVNKSNARQRNSSRNGKGGVTFWGQTEQDIIFPDSSEVIFEPVPRIDGPPKCANGKTFCEHFDSYPKYHIQGILDRNPTYNSFWGKDEVPIDISNRVAGEERFLCSSLQRTIFPNVAKNKNKKWKYVINQPDGNYKQGIRIETCRSHGGPCDLIGELPDGYETSCKQKFIYRRLLALGDEGDAVIDSFEIPSACCCAYKRNLDFLARFGARITPTKKGKNII